MGLAVYAYSSLRFVESASLVGVVEAGLMHPLLDDPRHALIAAPGEAFRPRLGGMREGFYAVEGRISRFSAGSYSSYNAWRARLASMMGLEVRAIWDGSVTAPAFGELIDFSDCDGSIGGETAAKLAGDFVAWAARAEAYAFTLGRDGRGFLADYRRWRQLFELAAQGGAVCFR